MIDACRTHSYVENLGVTDRISPCFYTNTMYRNYCRLICWNLLSLLTLDPALPYRHLNAISKPTFSLILNWNHKRLCIPRRTLWRYTNVVLLLLLLSELRYYDPFLNTRQTAEWRRQSGNLWPTRGKNCTLWHRNIWGYWTEADRHSEWQTAIWNVTNEW